MAIGLRIGLLQPGLFVEVYTGYKVMVLIRWRRMRYSFHNTTCNYLFLKGAASLDVLTAEAAARRADKACQPGIQPDERYPLGPAWISVCDLT